MDENATFTPLSEIGGSVPLAGGPEAVTGSLHVDPISYSLTKTEQGVQLFIQPSATARAERQGFVMAGVSAAVGALTIFLFGIGILTVIVALFAFAIAALFLWGV